MKKFIYKIKKNFNKYIYNTFFQKIFIFFFFFGVFFFFILGQFTFRMTQNK